jgi:hypothetical protein
MIKHDTTLPPCLAQQQREPLAIDYGDDLPPWLGERMRDTTFHIHRAAIETAQDSEDAA